MFRCALYLSRGFAALVLDICLSLIDKIWPQRHVANHPAIWGCLVFEPLTRFVPCILHKLNVVHVHVGQHNEDINSLHSEWDRIRSKDDWSWFFDSILESERIFGGDARFCWAERSRVCTLQGPFRFRSTVERDNPNHKQQEQAAEITDVKSLLFPKSEELDWTSSKGEWVHLDNTSQPWDRTEKTKEDFAPVRTNERTLGFGKLCKSTFSV